MDPLERYYKIDHMTIGAMSPFKPSKYLLIALTVGAAILFIYLPAITVGLNRLGLLGAELEGYEFQLKGDWGPFLRLPFFKKPSSGTALYLVESNGILPGFRSVAMVQPASYYLPRQGLVVSAQTPDFWKSVSVIRPSTQKKCDWTYQIGPLWVVSGRGQVTAASSLLIPCYREAQPETSSHRTASTATCNPLCSLPLRG